jgi:hypothetical protein
MARQICDAVISVDEAMLRRVWDEISFRWDIHLIANGSLIDHL